MLRNMEQEGVLESDWELEKQRSGPGKRYTLTEKGGHCLDQWMRTLTSHQASVIANLLLFLQDARSGMNSEPCPMPEHSDSRYPQQVFLSAGSPFPPASCGCGTPQPFAGAVHMNTYSFIDALKNRALRGMPVSRDEGVALAGPCWRWIPEEAAYLWACGPGYRAYCGRQRRAGVERHRHRLPPLLDELRVSARSAKSGA